MELSKSKTKCFPYKRSRIDKLVSENITKNRSKEEKVTLKRIKEVGEKIYKREEINRMNQQVRLKNVKKSKKSLGRKPNEEKEENEKNDLDMIPESHKINNGSKSSFHNPRAWREFMEVKKEINALNGKQFMSTDSVVIPKVQTFAKSDNFNEILHKSGSVDSTNSPTVMQALFNKTDIQSFANKKIKITSSKDLRNLQPTKTRIASKSKSKGGKKLKKGEKI